MHHQEHDDLAHSFMRQQADQKIANAGGTKQVEEHE